MKLPKYTRNLQVEDGYVISYCKRVAKIQDGDLVQLGYWSVTTQKHINYAANHLGLNLVRS